MKHLETLKKKRVIKIVNPYYIQKQNYITYKIIMQKYKTAKYTINHKYGTHNKENKNL